MLAVSLRFVVVVDDKELNPVDSERILSQAIIAQILKNGQGKPILPDDLLCKADYHAAEFSRETLRDFVLVSSLSVMSLPAPTIRSGKCDISSIPNRNAFSLPESLGFQAKNTPLATHLANSKYQHLRVDTKGRSAYEAVQLALNELHLLRAMWTLSSSYGSWRFSGGIPSAQTASIIHIGPIHTLHDASGKLAGDIYWYEPQYTGDQALFDAKGGWDRIDRQRHTLQRWVRQSLFRGHVEDLLLRYVSALDQRVPETAVLQLWGILEKTTGTVGANYEETLRRVARPYTDRSVVVEIMQSLRICRNRFVHSGGSSDKNEQVVYLVKSLVDDHLVSLIRNDFRAQSMEEHAKFLGLPYDLDKLKRQRKQLSRAVYLMRKALRKSKS